MASIRELKKDIEYLTFEVIADCFAYMEVHQEAKGDEVIAIINDAVDLRNDLITRINNPESKESPKAVKAHYSAIRRDLFIGIDSCFSRLSALTPA